MKIAVLGQGYVGLTAAVCLADAGHEVAGVECNDVRLSSLLQGRAPFYEPGVQELLRQQLDAGNLSFYASLGSIPLPVDAVMVCVGSPQLPSGGADLRQLAGAMREIVSMTSLPALIMVKSTVPPGTSARLIAEAGGTIGLHHRYVYSPEFLSQGNALSGWTRPSRIVVGLEDESLLPIVTRLYSNVAAPWLVTTPTNAELVKYASNAFLATKISFVNEIANLCDEVGACVDDVVEGIGLDPRIGTAFLRPGVGYGGSCFPKDVRALTHLSNQEGRSMPLLEAVIAVNNAQRLRVLRVVREHLAGTSKAVAVLGLSFKPDTDDVREAPSVAVVSDLVAHGYDVRVWDPAVDETTFRDVFPGAARHSTIAQATAGASAVVVLTEWPDLVRADWEGIARSLRPPRLVVDGRNCLNPQLLTALGIVYRGIGRGSARAADAPPLQSASLE